MKKRSNRLFFFTTQLVLLCMLFAVSAQAQSGASVTKKVTVPASMKTSPFNIDRYLKIPPGFEIAVYARVPKVRFMAVAPNGDLLVSVPDEGKVKIIRKTSGDPAISDFVSGLNHPHDIVFHTINTTTYVYISEQNQINRYTYTSGDLTGKSRQVVISNLPDASLPELHGAYAHTLKNIALDGNHNLYVSIASSCNACTSDTESSPVRGSIYIYNADGTNGRLFARGIRNAEGLAFVPGTNQLWVVINNRDNIIYPYNDGSGNYGKSLSWFIDNNPPDEFTLIEEGGNYGWPFCNPDPRGGLTNMPFANDYELNKNGTVDCNAMNRIYKGIQAHSAPLGLTFLQNTTFPDAYKNGAVIGIHGSWNRVVKTGYKVLYFPWDAVTQRPGEQIDLVTGFLSADSSSVYGRPVDMAVTAEGDLLFSDDLNGTIYKLYYTGITTDLLPEEIETSATLYPVPADKVLNVRFHSVEVSDVTVEITTLQGKAVAAVTQKMVTGQNTVTLNVEPLASGIYLVKVSRHQKTTVEKIVIE